MHPLLLAAALRQHGLFTAADARRSGYAHPEIGRLCASGRWRRLRRGVYTTAEELGRAEEEGRRHQLDCLAVLLALDRSTAALSHVSAARLSGFAVPRHPDDVRLTDPAHNRAGRGFTVTKAPLDDGEVRTAGAFRLTVRM